MSGSTMDILSQSSLWVGITSFGLGFSVLGRNFKNKLYLAFAGVCSLISAWALFFFVSKVWSGGDFYRFHLLLNIWLGPAALKFIQLLVRANDKISKRLFATNFFISSLLSIGLAKRFEYSPWGVQFMYFAPVFVALQILLLMWTDRHLHLPSGGVARKNLIYFGGLFVLATTVMDHVPYLGSVLPVIGNLALITYLFFLSQAISKQKFLNFGALLSRFFVLLGLALVLTLVYLLLFAWIKDNPPLFLLNSFMVSFLILMLLEPLRTMVRFITQSLLTQKHLRLEATLAEAQRRLSTLVEADPLFTEALERTGQWLEADDTALYVLEVDGTRFKRVKMISAYEKESGPKEVLVNHPLLNYCAKLEEKGLLPIALDQVFEAEIERSTSRSQRIEFDRLLQSLLALSCHLLIPLFHEGELLGFITARAPTPPEPWGNNWALLQIIYPYFSQVAQTLKSLEVYEKSREKERLATIGEMAAGLAHEIRNPLGAIKGAAQFLDPSLDRPESRFLQVIIEEVDRLNGVVTQFLDYSKPQTLQKQRVDLNELVKRTVDFLKAGVSDRVHFEILPAESGAILMASPEQLKQVLMNFIQNSLKAVEGRSTGKIVVSVLKSIDLDKINLVVEDNGTGIKDEHLNRLFIPFFTTSPSGTGLGLSICQKIIEAHRGRIDVVSEPGKFARFIVTLPSAPC